MGNLCADPQIGNWFLYHLRLFIPSLPKALLCRQKDEQTLHWELQQLDFSASL